MAGGNSLNHIGRPAGLVSFDTRKPEEIKPVPVAPVVKYDALSVNSGSAVTYNTEQSLLSGRPSTFIGSPSVNSSQLAVHIDFLARELELER